MNLENKPEEASGDGVGDGQEVKGVQRYRPLVGNK